MKCPICSNSARILGSIPFDRNNCSLEVTSLVNMEYHKCNTCYFIFCSEMLQWTSEQLGERVYNEEYVIYDPDYIELRPKNYARFFIDQFPLHVTKNITHLDYGSGTGVMSKELTKVGWNSTSYDPYFGNTAATGSYDLVTAIEVFEHSLDIRSTIKDIKKLLKPSGLVIFSTQLASASTDITWWYIGARNGHISILSKESMKILAIENGMYFSSLSDGIHVLQSNRSNLQKTLGVKYNGR